jgi:hypothetical protein
MNTTADIVFWSRAGASRFDEALRQPQSDPGRMNFEADGRFYAGTLRLPAAGTLVLDLVSPRPFRLWVGGLPALDEGLSWRLYEREVRAAVVLPCGAGEVPFLVEVGKRPGWIPFIDTHCPSRNREHVREELRIRHPDRLVMNSRVEPGVQVPGVCLRFMTAQFHRDGIVWQQILARPIPGLRDQPPSQEYWSPLEEPEEAWFLATTVLPNQGLDLTGAEERSRGLRRLAVPVANTLDAPPPLRAPGETDKRIEPSLEIARTLPLTIQGPTGSVTLPLPAYESLGRLAPVREFRTLTWPTCAEAKPLLPEPVLPESWAGLGRLYDAAWAMLFGLLRNPRPESGLPNSYLGTAGQSFQVYAFVWDSSFTAMCTAYGWRALPATATLDMLYSRQFDGGYLHREHDTRDGRPVGFEPDFSPNPPITGIAEWALASLTGDRLRLAKVYPALCAQHRWLVANRRLPDGTFWTTGLANGLDNSPSLGDGYPCLTAQMAHDAETLSRMAQALGKSEEAAAWAAEQTAIGQALNARLWSSSQKIYATSLPDGGHNPNKVVTAFWPLWAGIVPPDRVACLAGHLQDPNSFWRHHPIPSLAADSPVFKPGGDYWQGSTWAPTNYAAIKGFDRAGRHDLAVAATRRHLQCMLEVYDATGHIWENYCSEASTRGSWSGPDYSWSALGPIALLIEVLLGFQPDALNNTLRWTPPDEPLSGIRNLAMGPATISVRCTQDAEGKAWIDVDTNRPFTLDLRWKGATRAVACPGGHSRIDLDTPVAGR